MIQKTKQKVDIADYIQVWIGLLKLGKTKLAAQFLRSLFLFTESGASDMELPHWTPDGWDVQTKGTYIITDGDDYDRVIIELLDLPLDKRPRTLILDTIDGFIIAGANKIMREFKADSLNDGALSYGRGNERLANWIIEKIQAFQQLNMGLIFISHTVEKTIYRVGSEPLTVHRDILPEKFKPIIHGIADWIWHFTKEGKQRVILTQGDITIEAGSRIVLPDRIPMGKSAQEAYQNVLNAFYGRNQTNGGKDRGKGEIINRILKGETYLSENKIDGFEAITRRDNSRAKHLTSPDLELNNIGTLNEYYLHLKTKSKEVKNGTT